eukprot:3955519-Amphidinium_carterae.1
MNLDDIKKLMYAMSCGYERRRRQQPGRQRHEGTTKQLHDKFDNEQNATVLKNEIDNQQIDKMENVSLNHHHREYKLHQEYVRHQGPRPMTIEQLREKVLREEDRLQRAREQGLQTAPPHPTHYEDNAIIGDEEDLQRQAAARNKEVQQRRFYKKYEKNQKNQQDQQNQYYH